MFRRPGTRISDLAAGFISGYLIKEDANENQTAVVIFELTGDGTIVEVPISNVKFTDGSPVLVPVV